MQISARVLNLIFSAEWVSEVPVIDRAGTESLSYCAPVQVFFSVLLLLGQIAVIQSDPQILKSFGS